MKDGDQVDIMGRVKTPTWIKWVCVKSSKEAILTKAMRNEKSQYELEKNLKKYNSCCANK